MAFKNAFFLLLFLLFFSVGAFSQEIFVSIVPLSHASPVSIYESETADFQLVVFNNETGGLKNFNARVFVDPSLAIVSGGTTKREQLFSFLLVPPKSTAAKTFTIRGISARNADLAITVKYGVGESLSSSYSMAMRVTKSPLSVNARVAKSFFAPLEENSVFLDLKNTSLVGLKNVSAELVVPPVFENRSAPVFFASFAPGQSVQNSSFSFAAPDAKTGIQEVLLVVKFEDAFGPHRVEKNFLVEAGKLNLDVFVFIGVLAILVLLVVFFGSKKAGKEAPKAAPKPDANKR